MTAVRFVAHTWGMRSRLFSVIAAAALLASACGGSNSSNTNDQPTTTAAASSGSSAPSTTSSQAAADTTTPGQALEDLITKANADGTVTADELSEMLVVTGVEQGQADCQAQLLAELGISDPTDLSALSGGSLATDQALQLSTCMAAALGG